MPLYDRFCRALCTKQDVVVRDIAFVLRRMLIIKPVTAQCFRFPAVGFSAHEHPKGKKFRPASQG